MVGGPFFKNPCRAAAHTPRHAPVEAQRDDVSRPVGSLARTDVFEVRQNNRANAVEVADDRGLALECVGKMQQLQAVQNLAVGEMNVGERYAVEMHDLGDAGRHTAGQGGNGKAQDSGFWNRMRSPSRQPINAPLHGMVEKMASGKRRQGRHVFRRFLKEKQIGVLASDQAGNVLGTRSDTTQQIPAYDAQVVGRRRLVAFHRQLAIFLEPRFDHLDHIHAIFGQWFIPA